MRIIYNSIKKLLCIIRIAITDYFFNRLENIFYVTEYRDVFMIMLRKFDPRFQTRLEFLIVF